MKFLRRFFEKRSTNAAPGGDSYWQDFGALRSNTVVTPRNAESISAVYACVAAISETIGSLPLFLYRKTGDEGRERAPDHPLYRVLHDSPNGRQSALEFREMLTAHMLLRGNAYARVVTGADGQVRELWPLHPDSVQVIELDSGRLAYDVADGKGRTQRMLQEEIFHIRHRSSDGVLGVSPVQAAREVLELALSERDHGVHSFRNGTRLSGVLQTDGQIDPGAFKGIQQLWQSAYAGTSNAARVAVLGGGLRFAPMSMTLEDAEWIAARQFSVEEVCRLFRVPPTMVGDLRHGNFSNTQELARHFVVHTLRRHLVAWEQAVSRQLLTEVGRRTLFAEHSVEGLLRGDSLNRSEFYHNGITDGWLTVDEARRYENLPKLEQQQQQDPRRFVA